MKQPFSKWSAVLSIIAAVFFYMSYFIAPVNPEGSIVIVIQLLFFTSILAAVLSIIFSLIALIKKDRGFLKFVAPVVIVAVLFEFLL
ncbi:hypothetical protein [Halobacillus salinus]|uniref:hypothetical protein n=1 Tax=Halobacillus salinus TaxID=192814 RepID=UPI0009A8C867|nr:hypothetical protein [Halobacillus salinus]